MTQREAPPRLPGIDDDEDERRRPSAPRPKRTRPSPRRSDSAQPGSARAAARVNYGKFNTPTAFTPQPSLRRTSPRPPRIPRNRA